MSSLIKSQAFYIFLTHYNRRIKQQILSGIYDGTFDTSVNSFAKMHFELNKERLSYLKDRKLRRRLLPNKRYIAKVKRSLNKKMSKRKAKRYWVVIPKYNSGLKIVPYRFHLRIIFLWYLKYMDLYIDYYFEVLFSMWLNYFFINSSTYILFIFN